MDLCCGNFHRQDSRRSERESDVGRFETKTDVFEQDREFVGVSARDGFPHPVLYDTTADVAAANGGDWSGTMTSEPRNHGGR